MKAIGLIFVVVLWLVCVVLPLAIPSSFDWIKDNVESFVIGELVLTGTAIAIFRSLIKR